jgi:sulfur carrier protein ThiS
MKLITGGYLSFYLPGRKNQLQIEIDGPVPLKDVLRESGIPLGEVFLTAINGIMVDLEQATVYPEDVVNVVSAIDGG